MEGEGVSHSTSSKRGKYGKRNSKNSSTEPRRPRSSVIGQMEEERDRSAPKTATLIIDLLPTSFFKGRSTGEV